MILVEYRAMCDKCRFTSETVSLGGLRSYLDDSLDGKWTIINGGRMHICRGCVVDRACRIFGHAIVRQPAVLGGRTWCTRCQTFQAVAS